MSLRALPLLIAMVVAVASTLVLAEPDSLLPNMTLAKGFSADIVIKKEVSTTGICSFSDSCSVSGYEGACVSISAGIKYKYYE